MRKAIATATGFIVAPVVAAAIFAALGLIFDALNHELPDKSILQLAEVFYVAASISAAVLGIPLYFLFKYVRLIRWWTCAAAGFATGAVADMVLNHAWIQYAIPEEAAYGAIGAASAIVFWLIWKQGREP